jgi:putative N6-adenine-specific DNA methylase
MRIIITTLFGLETPVKEDLKAIGFTYDQITVTDGVVTIETGDDWPLQVARVNMWVRRGERVLLEIGEFEAKDFDSFFDGTKALPWNDFIPKGYAYIVNGFSRKSKLFGVPALQSLAKKAIARSILTSRNMSEDGILYEDASEGVVKVQFGIVNDKCRFMLDTTGEGLHKRGYRVAPIAAPLKETLAAAMIELSFWHADRVLIDPCCGSGTIPIEAALIGRNIAPGLKRSFASEKWDLIPEEIWREERERAKNEMKPDVMMDITACDIDTKAVSAAMKNAAAAGVADTIRFRCADIRKTLQVDEIAGSSGKSAEKADDHGPKRVAPVHIIGANGKDIGAAVSGINKPAAVSDVDDRELPDNGIIITNPVYGERLGDQKQADYVFAAIHDFMAARPDWSVFMITPDKKTEEKTAGRRADRRRKLYNGNIEVCYYQFHGVKKK